MIRLFATNPFHVLAVRATTDQRTLRRILEERNIQVQLGMHPQGLTAEVLRSFRQTIETPERRVLAELFALHGVDPGLPAEQLPVLRERAQAADGLERTLLYHDVAVTAHLLWALSDADSSQGIDALRISLSAWRPVLREKGFWDYLAARGEGSTSAERLWQECVLGLVGSAADASGAFLEHGRLSPALALVGVLRAAALPGDSIDGALRDVTRDTRGEIRAAIQQIAARTEGTVADARLDEIAIINEVLGPYRRLVLLGLPPVGADEAADAVRTVSVRVYNLAKDPFVAVALLDAGLAVVTAPRLVASFAADRATVMRLHHQERAVTAWQAHQWAATAAHATLAADVSDREETQRFRDIAARAAASSSSIDVADWIHRAQAPFEAERLATNRRIDAAAHFQQWVGTDRAYIDPAMYDFGPPASTTPSAAAPTARPEGTSQRGKWILASAVAGLLLLLWASGSLAGMSGARSTAAPSLQDGTAATARPPTPQRAAPTQARCVSDLANMRSEITSARSRLTSMESDLNALDRRIASARRSIDATEATYPRGIPSSIYPSYSAQVDDYNRLLRQYRDARADYENFLSQSNAEVDRYNTLLASCR